MRRLTINKLGTTYKIHEEKTDVLIEFTENLLSDCAQAIRRMKQ